MTTSPRHVAHHRHHRHHQPGPNPLSSPSPRLAFAAPRQCVLRCIRHSKHESADEFTQTTRPPSWHCPAPTAPQAIYRPSNDALSWSNTPNNQQNIGSPKYSSSTNASTQPYATSLPFHPPSPTAAIGIRPSRLARFRFCLDSTLDSSSSPSACRFVRDLEPARERSDAAIVLPMSRFEPNFIKFQSFRSM